MVKVISPKWLIVILLYPLNLGEMENIGRILSFVTPDLGFCHGKGLCGQENKSTRQAIGMSMASDGFFISSSHTRQPDEIDTANSIFHMQLLGKGIK